MSRVNDGKDNDVFSDDQPVKDKSGWSSEQASKIIEEEELSVLSKLFSKSVKSAKKSEKPVVKSEQESEGYSDDDWNEEQSSPQKSLGKVSVPDLNSGSPTFTAKKDSLGLIAFAVPGERAAEFERR